MLPTCTFAYSKSRSPLWQGSPEGDTFLGILLGSLGMPFTLIQGGGISEMSESRQEADALDRELIARFRNGDEDAARELHERHVQAMLEMINCKLRDVSSRGWYDAEGIVNSGFRSFFSAVTKPKYDLEKSRAVALLCTIVQRKFLVQARRPQRPSGHDPESLRLMVENAIAMSADAASMQEAESCVNEVMTSALAEATDQDRSILQRWLDKDVERTLDDIAEECGCSLSAVKGCLKRFESRLRELLAEGEPERS